MSAELHVVGDDLTETLLECRRRWAGVGAKLMMLEREPTWEGASQLQTLSIRMYDAFYRAQKLIEEREEA